MLATMRKGGSTIFAKIILGVLMLSFAVWGIGDVFHSNGSGVGVAKIGKRSISAIELEREIHREAEMLKERLGDKYNPKFLQLMNIPNQVLARKINEELFALEAKALGLVPSDEAVAEEIAENPMFRDEKGFDKNKFLSMVRNIGISERDYVEMFKRDMAIKLLIDTYSVELKPSQFSVRLADAIDQEKRDIAIYPIPKKAISQTAATDAQLTETYQKNAAQFVKPEFREVSYIELDKGGEEGITVAANKLEDSLAGGASLAEAAKEVGAVVERIPEFTAQGRLVNGEKAILPPLDNFLKTVFETEQGTESNVVMGGSGKMYLVRVEKITPSHTPPLAEVRQQIEALWRKENEEKAYQIQANEIASGFAKKDEREKIIAKYALSSSSVTTSRKDQKLPLEIVQESFTLKEDEATGAFQSANGEYLIGVLRKIHKPVIPAYNPKSENETRLKSELEQEKLEIFLNYLRVKYKVEVNDEKLNTILEAE